MQSVQWYHGRLPDAKILLSFLAYINCTISEMRGISLFDLLSTFVFGAASAITFLNSDSAGTTLTNIDSHREVTQAACDEFISWPSESYVTRYSSDVYSRRFVVILTADIVLNLLTKSQPDAPQGI